MDDSNYDGWICDDPYTDTPCGDCGEVDEKRYMTENLCMPCLLKQDKFTHAHSTETIDLEHHIIKGNIFFINSPGGCRGDPQCYLHTTIKINYNLLYDYSDNAKRCKFYTEEKFSASNTDTEMNINEFINISIAKHMETVILDTKGPCYSFFTDKLIKNKNKRESIYKIQSDWVSKKTADITLVRPVFFVYFLQNGYCPWDPKRIVRHGYKGYYPLNIVYNKCFNCNLIFPTEPSSPVCNDCLVDIYIPMIEHRYKEKGISKYIEEYIR